MKAVILYNDSNIYVEFEPDKFKELLKKYMEETNDVSIAIDKIVEDLKQLTKYK